MRLPRKAHATNILGSLLPVLQPLPVPYTSLPTLTFPYSSLSLIPYPLQFPISYSYSSFTFPLASTFTRPSTFRNFLRSSHLSPLRSRGRHGTTFWNLAKRWQGEQDTELAPEGVQQARDTAQLLKTRLERRPWRIYSSDLLRARRTAEIYGEVLGCEEPRSE